MTPPDGGENGKERGWTSYSIRRPVVDRIEDFLSKRLDPTITNPTQFIDLAIREKLEREERAGKKGGGPD